MKFRSSRFGEIEVADTSVITFPKGILGFEDYKNFVLIPVDEKGETPFIFLQSIESEEVEFFLLDTLSFFKEYEIQLEDQAVEKLQLETPADASVLTTVTVKGEIKAATTNLKAPIVINHKQQLGMQILLDNLEYQIKQPLFQNNEKATVGQV